MLVAPGEARLSHSWKDPETGTTPALVAWSNTTPLEQGGAHDPRHPEVLLDQRGRLASGVHRV